MADLSTKWTGLNLKGPVIVSSCGLTADQEKVALMEKAGAGAVVVKSLFEEQIRNEVEYLSASGSDHTEMDDYMHSYIRHNSIAQYCANITRLKSTLSIPVIASINCYTPGTWVEFAKEMQKAGADAIEVNLYEIPLDKNLSPEIIERRYLDVVKEIVKSVTIPVSVKIGQNFTSITNFINKLYSFGAKGVVIFNRFFTPDINLDSLSLVPSSPLSHEYEYIHNLRWTAIISSSVSSIDIATTTGIHTPDAAIKTILAGAKAVQICSTIYKNGIDRITLINEELAKFMDERNFSSIEQMRGILNYSCIKDPAMYERVQFMKSFGGYKNV